MEKRVRTAFTEHGLKIGSDEVPLFSGSMHYWHVHPSAWPDCLAAMKRLGLRIVCTYVPWGVHETSPGKYDFREALDLGAFLDRIADADGGRESEVEVLAAGSGVNAGTESEGEVEGQLQIDEDRLRAVEMRGFDISGVEVDDEFRAVIAPGWYADARRLGESAVGQGDPGGVAGRRSLPCDQRPFPLEGEGSEIVRRPRQLLGRSGQRYASRHFASGRKVGGSLAL